MSSSGHAFISHTKALSPRAQSKDGGYGPVPHPLRVRAGQCYWPRAGRRRGVLVVQRVDREAVVLIRPGERRTSTRIAASALLAVRSDGQGLRYQFQGFTPRRYDTSGYVWSLDVRDAVLCLPEWHPRRPVRLPARLLAAPVRHHGVWLELKCDLSASSAGRLQPSDLAAGGDPTRPAWLHLPDLPVLGCG